MNTDNIVTGNRVLVKRGSQISGDAGVSFAFRPYIVTVAGRFGSSVAWFTADGTTRSTHVDNLRTVFALEDM